MSASRFQSRPVAVEAIRWVGSENCAEVFAFGGDNHDDWADETDHSIFHVPGLIDSRPARHGDWLVKDERGVVTVIRDAAFTARYEQIPEPEPFDPATNYHESTDHFRRDLIAGQAMWHQMMDASQDKRDDAHKDAFMASLMAGSYSYTLAAILGHAARQYGERVARDLAFEADELLTNGDFDAMNADIIVALAEGAALPDYVTVNPSQGAHGEMPGAHWRCEQHKQTGTWDHLEDNALAARADAITHLNERHPGWDKPTEAGAEQAEIPAGGGS